MVVRCAWCIQVSDVDNILGLLQTEVIQVHAEAYDVALDMSFPKGSSFVVVVLLQHIKYKLVSLTYYFLTVTQHTYLYNSICLSSPPPALTARLSLPCHSQ